MREKILSDCRHEEIDKVCHIIPISLKSFSDNFKLTWTMLAMVWHLCCSSALRPSLSTMGSVYFAWYE